ncbi:MAG TPA: carbon-nitrogen hydrolase family protein [Planctomycetes bacterium]|nr:carbon-nitrogen hydrolase family protein [Planctomycetota bacterium]
MKVSIAQIAPVYLDREATIQKMARWVHKAGEQGCDLLAFGESLVPGYPVWLHYTGGARFDDPLQKSYYARYVQEAVDPEGPHLAPLRQAAASTKTALVFGIVERSGHSLYCSRLILDARGDTLSLHRKLMPTYEERLVWALGDAKGLVTHPIGEFRVGALNCWENWMPLARAALYAEGEDLHVMLWPGNLRNTEDLSPVLAKEGRSYLLSASGLLRGHDLPSDLPARDLLPKGEQLVLDGGSCIVGPEGKILAGPLVGQEGLLSAELDIRRVREERQNFDPAGHYARPEILDLRVHRKR